MEWIYLSPHFDDVALSVGGLLWEQSRAGEQASIWTVCGAGPPPGDYSPFAESLHTRWKTGTEAIQTRRAEDVKACQYLGANFMHFDIPDCIYRRSPKTGEHLYASEESLWIPVHSDEDATAINWQLHKRRPLFPQRKDLTRPHALATNRLQGREHRCFHKTVRHWPHLLSVCCATYP